MSHNHRLFWRHFMVARPPRPAGKPWRFKVTPRWVTRAGLVEFAVDFGPWRFATWRCNAAPPRRRIPDSVKETQ